MFPSRFNPPAITRVNASVRGRHDVIKGWGYGWIDGLIFKQVASAYVVASVTGQKVHLVFLERRLRSRASRG